MIVAASMSDCLAQECHSKAVRAKLQMGKAMMQRAPGRQLLASPCCALIPVRAAQRRQGALHGPRVWTVDGSACFVWVWQYVDAKAGHVVG